MSGRKQPLSVTHPELAAQADGWDPTSLSAGSGKKVKWKCEKGHAWEAKIGHRTNGSNCPVCSGRTAWVGHNDLATTNPELAAQADGWDPTSLSAGSGRKVKWKCEKNHIWEATVAHRSIGTGCPICSNKKVLAGYNDLATTHPELAAQAHGWDPTSMPRGSDKRVSWICERRHTWQASVLSRTSGTGCPICANKKTLSGFNDLATTNPQLAAQADGWDPTTVVAFSNKKVGWKCINGHMWTSTVTSRSNGVGCPVCSGHRVLVGFNDLATTHPELAAQADGWDASTVTAGSDKRCVWKCHHEHIWTAVVGSRARGSGCPVCANQLVMVGVNDLATINPDLAAEATGWDPKTLSQWSNRKMSWLCHRGHIWKARVAERSNGNGCPICSGQKVLAGFNDLLTTNPQLAAEANNWDPTTLPNKSGKKVGWKCSLGHEWSATVAHRSDGSGCPVCSGRTVLFGFNDLATINPELASQADGWDPTTVVAFSNNKVGWQCENGHKWNATINNRSQGRGCPSCSQAGFDPNLSGWLYFIDHDALNMYQIGISNYPKQRLESHTKRGWEVIEVRGPIEGHLAQQLETAILHAVERRGAVLGHKAEIEKFDGYSEAWTKDSLTVASFKQLLDWVYEDDGTRST
jgi:hypothetical protein